MADSMEAESGGALKKTRCVEAPASLLRTRRRRSAPRPVWLPVPYDGCADTTHGLRSTKPAHSGPTVGASLFAVLWERARLKWFRGSFERVPHRVRPVDGGW